MQFLVRVGSWTFLLRGVTNFRVMCHNPDLIHLPEGIVNDDLTLATQA